MINTDIVVSIEEPIISIAILHNILLLSHVIYKHYCIPRRLSQDSSSSKTQQEVNKALANITIITLLSFITLNVLSILTIVSVKWFPHFISCKIWIAMGLIAYYSSKFFFWYYCVIRIQLAFKESPHLQYPKIFLHSLKIIFISIAIALCVNFYFNITTFKQGQHCWIIASFWVFPLDGFVQASCYVICYWLFHRKMKKIMVNLKEMQSLTKQQNSSNNTLQSHQQNIITLNQILEHGIEHDPDQEIQDPDIGDITGIGFRSLALDLENITSNTSTNTTNPSYNVETPTHSPRAHVHSRSSSLSEIKHNVKYDYQLLYVTRKYAILTAISILTTVILILFSVPMGSVLGIGSIDSIINGWCIVLFDAKYNQIYIKLCPACIARPEWNGPKLVQNKSQNDKTKNNDNKLSSTNINRRSSQVIIDGAIEIIDTTIIVSTNKENKNNTETKPDTDMKQEEDDISQSVTQIITIPEDNQETNIINAEIPDHQNIITADNDYDDNCDIE